MALIVRTPRIRHMRRRTLESFKRSRRFMAWLEYHADRTEARAVEVEAGAGFTAEAEVDPAEQGNEE